MGDKPVPRLTRTVPAPASVLLFLALSAVVTVSGSLFILAFQGGIHDLAQTPADLTVIGAAVGDDVGHAVATGDFNGDGFDDLAVGAPQPFGGPQADEGRVHVIFGSAAIGGLVDLAVGPTGLTVIGADSGDELGASIASGDLNDDGVDDLVIGAPGAAGAGNAKAEAGEAYVLFGSPNLGGTIDLGATSPGVTVLAPETQNRLGTAVAAGDINGDGIADLLIGAPGSFSGCQISRSFVVFGASTLTSVIDLATTDADLRVVGAQCGHSLGWSLASADFNDDGVDDLAVGAPGAAARAGEAYVLFGGSTVGGTIDVGTTSPNLIVRGIVDTLLGFSAAAGDVNGDAVDDLLLGMPGGSLLSGGFTAVIHGSDSLGGLIEVTTNLPGQKADVLLQGTTANDRFGESVTAGDFNGDGTRDIVVGAPGNGPPSQAHVLFGRPAFPAFIDLLQTSPNFTLLEAQPAEALGASTSTGDFNADGFEDLVVGAPDPSLASSSVPGAAYVLLGGPVDSDGDGVDDHVEVKTCGTDPFDSDSDDDGVADGIDVDCLEDQIASLPQHVFKSSGDGHRDAMLSVVAEIEQLISEAELGAVSTKLQNLRKRVDGCNSVADSNDWILACPAQIGVRELIDLILANLGGV
jgi:FG-GAP repeat